MPAPRRPGCGCACEHPAAAGNVSSDDEPDAVGASVRSGDIFAATLHAEGAEASRGSREPAAETRVVAAEPGDSAEEPEGQAQARKEESEAADDGSLLGSNLTEGSTPHPVHLTTLGEVGRTETYTCALFVLSYAVLLAHVYIYPAYFGVEVCPAHEVPSDELGYFHHGWTAVSVIFYIEAIPLCIRVWATRQHPLLASAVAQKMEGNIGVLFAEYIIVAATYSIMGYNRMPVFVEPRTGRRVYPVRFVAWLVDGCGLAYLDCRVLFGQPFARYRTIFVYVAANMLFGLWSAISPTWALHYLFLAAAWLFFAITCAMLVNFLRRDPEPLQPFGRAPIKRSILAFIILWQVLYGVVFMLAFQAPASLLPQWLEQLLWTGMDVIMKLSHTCVLLAWRASQREIEAFLLKQKAEAHSVVARIDRQRAVVERDLAEVRGRLRRQSSRLGLEDGAECVACGGAGCALCGRGPELPAHPTMSLTSGDMLPGPPALAPGVSGPEVPTPTFRDVNWVYLREAGICGCLLAAYAAAVVHLQVYSRVFGVELAPQESAAPAAERAFFHHGWTSMIVVFLIEAIAVILKVWSTWHDPNLAMAAAEKFGGHIGALIGEYFVVGTTYALMGFNLAPVFLEPRTGRRVYGARFMAWLVDSCGLVYLDCRCLFGRSFPEFRAALAWTAVNMMCGLWSALASSWAWHWFFLLCSWLSFFMVCAIMVRFMLSDPYPLEPFGRTLVKPFILALIIGWQALYGVVFMISFWPEQVLPEWLEQLAWTGMDVVLKLFHTAVLIAWRATESEFGALTSKRRAEKRRTRDLRIVERAKAQKQEIIDQEQEDEFEERGSGGGRSRSPSPPPRARAANWTATPGLSLDIASMLRLEAHLGQGAVSQEQRKSMMRAEDLEELRRLEQAGSVTAKLQEDFVSNMRDNTFLAHGINHIAYDPRSWFSTLLAVRGRAPTSGAMWVLIAESIVVACLAQIAPEIAPHLAASLHSLLSGSVAFLMVFRTEYAFRKWWDGRTAFENITSNSRTVSQQICAYVTDVRLVDKMVRYVIVNTVATRCHLRKTRIDPHMLAGILTKAEVEEVNRQDNMPYYTTWVIRYCLGEALATQTCLPCHMAIDAGIRALECAMADAERLLTPMAFTYVVHLRTFLFLYLLGLPFILVADLGWFMVIAVAVVSYLMIGLENTAVQLENPFGLDCNHHPLDLYCLEVVRDLLSLLDIRAGAAVEQPLRLRMRRSSEQMDECDDGAD